MKPRHPADTGKTRQTPNRGPNMTEPDHAEGQTTIEEFIDQVPAGEEGVQSPDAVARAVAAPPGEDPGPVTG